MNHHSYLFLSSFNSELLRANDQAGEGRARVQLQGYGHNGIRVFFYQGETSEFAKNSLAFINGRSFENLDLNIMALGNVSSSEGILTMFKDRLESNLSPDKPYVTVEYEK